MSQEHLKNSMNGCKCVKCKQRLVDPVQLGACLHIMCKKCATEEESRYLNNMNCPLCGKENAKPSILNRISGIEFQTGAALNRILCDFEPSHGNGIWNCFLCAKNFCSQCRSNHPLDHAAAINLSVPPCDVRLFEENGNATANGNNDGVDGALCSSSNKCPLCEGTSCPHCGVLEILETGLPAEDALCDISTHVDCNEQPLAKNYFCLKCWLPICGKCSKEGEHKLHKSKDLEKMKEYLKSNVADLKHRLAILITKAKMDQENQIQVEDGLKMHVESVSAEMNSRKCKILEEVTRFFNNAVDDAEHLGKDIVREYGRAGEKTKSLCRFLETLSSALNIQVDETLNILQYVSLFDNLPKAEGLVEQIRKKVMDHPELREHQLVLCGLDMFRPCQKSVASVGRECKQPPLAFSFKMAIGIKGVHSIIVKGSNQCFLSCEMPRERANDAILHYLGESSEPKETVIDVQRGRYYITQLVTEEIVASYSSEYGNAIKYFESDELLLTQGNYAQFEQITRPLDFEPRGIAATKQNTLLLCTTIPADKKGQGKKPGAGCNDASYLMLMSLQGKVLKDAQHTGTDALSPNCVAVKYDGEICVCDSNNSTIAILDPELRLKEKVKFSFPTSLSRNVLSYIPDKILSATDPNLTFKPEGVCYDKYGRIIVADSNNNMIVRLFKAVDGQTYVLEPFIYKKDNSELQHFRCPKQVAFGDDGRLWVVCQEYIFVFNYGI